MAGGNLAVTADRRRGGRARRAAPAPLAPVGRRRAAGCRGAHLRAPRADSGAAASVRLPGWRARLHLRVGEFSDAERPPHTWGTAGTARSARRMARRLRRAGGTVP